MTLDFIVIVYKVEGTGVPKMKKVLSTLYLP